ncbi:hypothetical protein Mal64_31470 [Pseudobythopirellula maris]|uniref:IncA protein n=1 Tax=Pseudobythopirellula maris TaxID=2527991 RepID=A0A5C5ZKE9_9BACT|nr:hypothetical protein [Pseudobythopirellula maris]TWT87605.1 hypothetical protein Mal64_31470 [Pseudobythopirellula maris]
MSRRRADNSATFTLFPFLAVLLCTMGALVILLVAMSHVAEETAAEEHAEAQRLAAEAVDTEEQVELRGQLEEVERFHADAQRLRKQASEQLEREQAALAQAEDHIRRMQDDLERLELAAQELFALKGEHFDDQRMAEDELRRLKELIEETEREIEELEREAAQQTKKSYAVVPALNEGIAGTHRRPVYLECRADGVYIQPEGVRLVEEDFYKPIEVSSPLAAALRAANKHLTHKRGDDGVPYPLLIVRPEGVDYYRVAHRVISSIEYDFGFQAVAADWDVAYPAPDPVMADQMARAIDIARAERAQLARAAPQLFRRDQPSRAMSVGGGLTARRSDSLGGNPFEGITVPAGALPSSSFNAGSAQSTGSSHDPGGAGSGGYAAGGGAYPPMSYPGPTANPSGSEALPSAGGNANQQADGGAYGQPYGGPTPTAQAAVGGPGSSGAAGHGKQGDGRQTSPSSTSPSNASLAGDGGASSGVSSNAAASSSGSQARLGSSGPDTAQRSEAGSASQVAANTSSTTASRAPSGAAERQRGDSAGRSQASNASKPQGSGVPITRGIRLIVRNDRVAILDSDRDLRGGDPMLTGRTVELTGPTAEHAQEVVESLRQHAESWGIAGEGLYWRPVLRVTAGPNSTTRAEELATVLEASGIAVRRDTATNEPAGGARGPVR